MTENLTDLCKRLEHWETDPWAPEAILRCEILTHRVIDPCAGTGIMTLAARRHGYDVRPLDIHDWGFPIVKADWLNIDPSSFLGRQVKEATVFMNPPFSKAEAFVEKAFEYGARKIVCFNKFSWWEGAYDRGKKRGQWWEKYRPCRIYVCGDRADCWRHDIPLDARGSGTPTAHAFFVWERGQPAGTMVSQIYKGGAA